MALVLVLCLIVLLSAIVMAFMSSARNDLVAATSYEAGQEAKDLAETAGDIVMSQIREATLSGISAQGVGSHAWASQPGAIRVWDSSGSLVQLYKLYSASLLKESSMSFLSGEIPTGWRDRPEEFVDLNEPVAKGAGASLVWRYPILNPDALGVVEGFSSQQVADSTVAWNSKTSMPVRWLYIGRGGTISNSRQPDSVGRVAFWTDDETCKVNINTASASASLPNIVSLPPGSSTAAAETRLGYSYWDLPYTQFVQDWNMARALPSQAEYQRYPGHPASVNLLGVFSGSSFSSLPEAQQKSTLKNAFALFPAYRWGGSENGRIPWTLASSRLPLSGANQKSERLYASVDELRFKASVSALLRDKNALPAGTQADETRLDYWRFFLTAHSRAPDVNLFGQPRVTIWPISDTDDTLHRTTQDNLIAFCSTYGPKTNSGRREFFFKRRNSLSQTEDWTNIPRNKKVFEYLQDLTARAIPGFGGNFRQKYDAADGGVAGERDQILTEIFDYIRCVNLNEAFEFKPAGFQSYTPTIDVPPSAQSDDAEYKTWTDGNYLSFAGAGMVLPILITEYNTRGAGRVPVLSEVALFALQQGLTSASAPDPSNKIQTALFFETFSPMQGYMPWTPKDFQLTVQTDMTVAGEPVFPGAAAGATTLPFNRSISNSLAYQAHQSLGGTDGFAWTLGTYPTIFDVSLDYKFARHRGTAIPAPSPATTPPKMQISSSSLQAELKMAGRPAYQTYNLAFPAALINVPQPSFVADMANNADWVRRRDANGMQFRAQDVAHSIVPKDGDYRIIAYLQQVPDGFFRAHPDYGSDKNFAHSLRQRKNYGQWGSTIDDGTSNGTFVSLSYRKERLPGTNDTYFWTDRPDLPPDLTDVTAGEWGGDWNNGLGDYPDGAYLGKSDDGMRNRSGSAAYLGGEYGWYSGAGFFSPTQAMPSGVMFGSLPTGVKRTEAAYRSGSDSGARPWRSLLFCPNPAKGSGHFGFQSPSDSLLLDLFTMPVVEPYAISEPSSTAGRINMNYQMLPFTSIERSTGLQAVLSSQRVAAIPDSVADTRHGSADNAIQGAIQGNTTRIRHQINMTETLRQFSDRFAAGDIFRSATEICSLYLVPEGQTLAGTPAWWKTQRVTGDNLRERPYATTYPLLTTKSNTYTVHVWAQTLGSGSNKVTGEYRGSTTLERYLDPGDERLVSPENDPDKKSLEPLYRFRVIETKRFVP